MFSSYRKLIIFTYFYNHRQLTYIQDVFFFVDLFKTVYVLRVLSFVEHLHELHRINRKIFKQTVFLVFYDLLWFFRRAFEVFSASIIFSLCFRCVIYFSERTGVSAFSQKTNASWIIYLALTRKFNFTTHILKNKILVNLMVIHYPIFYLNDHINRINCLPLKYKWIQQTNKKYDSIIEHRETRVHNKKRNSSDDHFTSNDC